MKKYSIAILVLFSVCTGKAFSQLPSQKPMREIAPGHIKGNQPSGEKIKALPSEQKEMPAPDHAKIMNRKKVTGASDRSVLPSSRKEFIVPGKKRAKW